MSDDTREQVIKELIDALTVADCVSDPADLGETEEDFWRFMVGKAVMPVIDDLRAEIARLYQDIKNAHEGMRNVTR